MGHYQGNFKWQSGITSLFTHCPGARRAHPYLPGHAAVGSQAMLLSLPHTTALPGWDTHLCGLGHAVSCPLICGIFIDVTHKERVDKC